MSDQQLRVVAVDDSEDDLLLLRLALRQAPNIKLVAALEDGLQAVSYFEGTGNFANRTLWPIPDLLILDIKMPKMDGFGVLEHFARVSGAPCPVVMLTSSLSEADRHRALSLGASAVFIKPANPAAYRETLSRMAAHCQASSGR